MSAPTILVLRALGLGDLLTGVPALRGLRRAHPGARLVLAAPAPLASWLQGLGIVDEVLATRGLAPLSWPGDAPDVAVNLHGSGPQSHAVLRDVEPGRLLAFAEPHARPEEGRQAPPWPADVHEVERWCSLVRRDGGPCDAEDLRLPTAGPRRSHVVLHPGAASGARRWPVARWRAVAASLSSAGHRVVVTGTSGESGLCSTVAAAQPQVIDACGRLELPELPQLVATAALVVSGDTGVAHLATAHGTPSVVLFGPTPPALWGPAIDHERHIVIWHPSNGDPRGDPHGTDLDLRLARVQVDEVVDAASLLLSRPRAQPA